MMMEGWVFLDPHRLWGASIPVRAKVQMVHWIVNISMVSQFDFLDGEVGEDEKKGQGIQSAVGIARSLPVTVTPADRCRWSIG